MFEKVLPEEINFGINELHKEDLCSSMWWGHPIKRGKKKQNLGSCGCLGWNPCGLLCWDISGPRALAFRLVVVYTSNCPSSLASEQQGVGLLSLAGCQKRHFPRAITCMHSVIGICFVLFLQKLLTSNHDFSFHRYRNKLGAVMAW